jgi:hypothetical protein
MPCSLSVHFVLSVSTQVLLSDVDIDTFNPLIWLTCRTGTTCCVDRMKYIVSLISVSQSSYISFLVITFNGYLISIQVCFKSNTAHSSVSIATGYRPEPRNGVRIPAGTGDSCLLHCVQADSGAHPGSHLMAPGDSPPPP